MKRLIQIAFFAASLNSAAVFAQTAEPPPSGVVMAPCLPGSASFPKCVLFEDKLSPTKGGSHGPIRLQARVPRDQQKQHPGAAALQ